MRIIYTCFLVLFFGISSSLSAQNMFIKLTGADGVITGESVADGFKDHLESLSFAQASSAACAGGTKEGCVANTGNFFFTVRLDKSLNPLRRHMYKGTPLTRVEIFFTRNGDMGKQQTYYSIRLDGVNVVSINESGSESERSTIQLEFEPQKIGWTYTQPGPDGRPLPAVKFGWDRTKNTEWIF